MHKPKGIIFDFGDTLMTGNHFGILAGYRRLLEFVNHPTDIKAEEILAASDELFTEMDALQNTSCLQIDSDCFDRLLFDRLGLTFSISPLETEREFWQAAANYHPIDGIIEVLSFLQKHQIKAGVLSNSSFHGHIMEQELVKHGLYHYFSFLISSADYGFRKPHPRIFQTALQKIGLSPQDVWFVGDKLAFDIKGAIDSNLFPVWYNCLNENNVSQYPCLEINNWHAFLNILKPLFK